MEGELEHQITNHRNERRWFIIIMRQAGFYPDVPGDISLSSAINSGDLSRAQVVVSLSISSCCSSELMLDSVGAEMLDAGMPRLSHRLSTLSGTGRPLFTDSVVSFFSFCWNEKKKK